MVDRHVLADLAGRAEALLREPVAREGFGVLMCEVGGGNRRPTLRVVIERPDGTPIDIEDCVRINDAVTDLLDTADLFGGPYVLEVSSPGLERPLKSREHFVAHVGQTVALRTWEPIASRRVWKGRLEGVDGDTLRIEVDGVIHAVPLPAVDRAHLVWSPPPKGEKKRGKPKATRKKEKP
jgi:ribosome maturation factor RimP